MQNYESMVIVRSTLSEEEGSAVLGKIKEMVEKLGGTILQAENWGKKRLAYEIEGEKKGIYLLFRFQAEGKLISQLEHQYRLDETILKFITVRLDRPLPAASSAGQAGDKKSAHEKPALEEAPAA
jgi:small subunit ribosomal protein S6